MEETQVTNSILMSSKVSNKLCALYNEEKARATDCLPNAEDGYSADAVPDPNHLQ